MRNPARFDWNPDKQMKLYEVKVNGKPFYLANYGEKVFGIDLLESAHQVEAFPGEPVEQQLLDQTSNPPGKRLTHTTELDLKEKGNVFITISTAPTTAC